jgi:hypothetical protein
MGEEEGSLLFARTRCASPRCFAFVWILVFPFRRERGKVGHSFYAAGVRVGGSRRERPRHTIVGSAGGAASFGFFLGDVAQEDVAQGDQAF